MALIKFFSADETSEFEDIDQLMSRHGCILSTMHNNKQANPITGRLAAIDQDLRNLSANKSEKLRKTFTDLQTHWNKVDQIRFIIWMYFRTQSSSSPASSPPAAALPATATTATTASAATATTTRESKAYGGVFEEPATARDPILTSLNDLDLNFSPLILSPQTTDNLLTELAKNNMEYWDLDSYLPVSPLQNDATKLSILSEKIEKFISNSSSILLINNDWNAFLTNLLQEKTGCAQSLCRELFEVRSQLPDQPELVADVDTLIDKVLVNSFVLMPLASNEVDKQSMDKLQHLTLYNLLWGGRCNGSRLDNHEFVKYYVSYQAKFIKLEKSYELESGYFGDKKNLTLRSLDLSEAYTSTKENKKTTKSFGRFQLNLELIREGENSSNPFRIMLFSGVLVPKCHSNQRHRVNMCFFLEKYFMENSLPNCLTFSKRICVHALIDKLVAEYWKNFYKDHSREKILDVTARKFPMSELEGFCSEAITRFIRTNEFFSRLPSNAEVVDPYAPDFYKFYEIWMRMQEMLELNLSYCEKGLVLGFILKNDAENLLIEMAAAMNQYQVQLQQQNVVPVENLLLARLTSQGRISFSKWENGRVTHMEPWNIEDLKKQNLRLKITRFNGNILAYDYDAIETSSIYVNSDPETTILDRFKRQIKCITKEEFMKRLKKNNQAGNSISSLESATNASTPYSLTEFA